MFNDWRARMGKIEIIFKCEIAKISRAEQLYWNISIILFYTK